jgi:hypothetical protein
MRTVCILVGYLTSSEFLIHVPMSLRKEKVRAFCAKFSNHNMTDDIGRTIKVLEDIGLV